MYMIYLYMVHATVKRAVLKFFFKNKKRENKG